MAYNNYDPMGYQGGYFGGNNLYQQQLQPMQSRQMQMVQPMQTPNQAQYNNGSLIWVQGEAGAKSFFVAPNMTVMLMDSESEKFYLKSTDASGVPRPLRVFEYHEIVDNQAKQENTQTVIQNPDYVTKTEFDAFKDEINKMLTAPKPSTTKITED